MSDSKDHPATEDAPEIEGQEPAEADEKTVFDTEMLARLDALGDDEDDDEDAEDEVANRDARSDLDADLPSQISRLEDIGDLVEPVTADVPLIETNPSSSLERLITDEIGEETKEAPEALDLDGFMIPIERYRHNILVQSAGSASTSGAATRRRQPPASASKPSHGSSFVQTRPCESAATAWRFIMLDLWRLAASSRGRVRSMAARAQIKTEACALRGLANFGVVNTALRHKA